MHSWLDRADLPIDTVDGHKRLYAKLHVEDVDWDSHTIGMAFESRVTDGTVQKTHFKVLMQVGTIIELWDEAGYAR